MQLAMIGLGRMGATGADSLARWTVLAAVEVGAPAHVLTASLYDRFASRGKSQYADKLLSAMRPQFGGHAEKVAA